MAWLKDAMAGVGLVVFFASGLFLTGAAQTLFIAG